ncbi:hypothetical protein AAC387_Pa01g2220 [Persea americana]
MICCDVYGVSIYKKTQTPTTKIASQNRARGGMEYFKGSAYRIQIWKQRDGVFIFYYGFHEGYRSDSLRNVEVTTLSSYE